MEFLLIRGDAVKEKKIAVHYLASRGVFSFQNTSLSGARTLRLKVKDGAQPWEGHSVAAWPRLSC